MKKLSAEFIEKELNDEDYHLLEKYKNANTAMSIICPEGHITKKRYNNWYCGSRCNLCKGNRISKAKKDQIKNSIEFQS
jgi:hypothetical protein